MIFWCTQLAGSTEIAFRQEPWEQGQPEGQVQLQKQQGQQQREQEEEEEENPLYVACSLGPLLGRPEEERGGALALPSAAAGQVNS